MEYIGKFMANQMKPVKNADSIESASHSIETIFYDWLHLFPVNGA